MIRPMSMADTHPDHRPPHLNRREMLRAGAALGVAAGLGVGAASRIARAAATRWPGVPAGRAKNVIFMVSDGMSTGTLSLADMMIRRQRSGRGSAWMGMWGREGVRRATARTHSLDSLVTDSAAGGSAWGCGVHINNGYVNVMPDGGQLLPILLHAKQAGKGTGVVTTARVTHATPASFYANSPRRDYEGMIGSQLLERGIDVALGGGRTYFPKSELDKHPEVQVVNHAAELRAARPEGRLLGIFDSGHVPFVLDRNETIPGLVEMSKVALARLEKNPDGFVLQIEGGRVDHAAHSNDAGSIVREQMEFDDAIAAVLEWTKGRDDTLVILTSDHGNANPGLTLYGESGNAGFARLEKAAKSFDWIDAQMSGIKPVKARVARMAESVLAATGRELTPGDQKLLEECMQDHRVMPFVEANHWPSVLGAILADHYGVSFVSPNHTADYVEVTATGPGSELIGIGGGGLIDNIDLHGVIVAALGLGEGKLLPGMETPMPLVKAVKPD
jgi:alkaline phosphatase